MAVRRNSALGAGAVALVAALVWGTGSTTPKIPPQITNDSGYLVSNDHINVAYARGFTPGHNVTVNFSWERGPHSIMNIGPDGLASESYNTTDLNPQPPDVVSFIDSVPGHVFKVVNVKVK